MGIHEWARRNRETFTMRNKDTVDRQKLDRQGKDREYRRIQRPQGARQIARLFGQAPTIIP